MSGTVFALKPPKWAGLFALAALAGCASFKQSVQWGGILDSHPVPAHALACETVEFATVDWVEPRMTNDIALTAYTVFGEDGFDVPMQFDIDADGRPVNIRFNGDEDMLMNAANRDGVYRMAHALQRSRYTWPDTVTVRFAQGCEHVETFKSEARWGATATLP